MLGHNLEKNLRKNQALREKGELENALRQLQDWARKHPDTPHYLYEAAMVAFDLRDYGIGVNSLKQLLRAVPNAEAKVLNACAERFTENPALPLCEFLVEHYISKNSYTEAFEATLRLATSELDIFCKKTAQRNQNLDLSSAEQAAIAAPGLFAMLAISNAQGNTEQFALCVESLLRCKTKHSQQILELCSLALERNPGDGHLRLAKGRAHCDRREVVAASREVAAACDAIPALTKPALEVLVRAKPDKDELGAYHFALGRVHLVAGTGATAAEHLWKAADLEPELREELVGRLERSEDPLAIEDLTAILKLHLRLLVVQGDFDRAQPLLTRLRDEDLCSAGELRGLLGDRAGNDDGRPSELMVLLAENALASSDLRALAAHLKTIPNSDGEALRRVLTGLRNTASEQPTDQRLEWMALQAILESRVRDEAAANATLIDLWRDDSLDPAHVFAVSYSCFEHLVPSPALLVAMLPFALANGESDTIREQLEMLLRHGESEGSDLVAALLSFVDMEPEHGAGLLDLVDSVDRGLGAKQLLRYPLALAALSSGQFDRAVPEFAVMLMGAGEERDEVLDRVRDIVRADAENADLQLAAYRILLEEGAREEAARHLGASLKLDSTRIGELSQDFEELLNENSDNSELWSNYARALFDARRFAQLDEICRRAAEKLPPNRSAEFRLIQSHMLVETGKLSEGLTILAAQVQSPGFDTEHAVVILRAITAANPAHGHAHMILGEMLVQTGDLDAALAAFEHAAEADPALLRSLMSKMREIATSASSEGRHLLTAGNFFRRIGQIPAAADSYERALELDESLAERLLGELIPEFEKPDSNPSLLLAGARAARLSGQLERACDLLAKLDERDDSRFEAVLAEYRHLQDDFPTELLPIHYVARVLYERDVAQAANQILLDTASNEAYGLAERIAMIEEFRSRRPEDGRLAVSLTKLYAEEGRVADVVKLIHSGLKLENFDAEATVVIAEKLRDEHPQNADLGFALHDLLQRSGNLNDALRAIPVPAAVADAQQSEISERFVPYARQVLADAELAPRYAESLRRQGRTDDCISALRTAAERVDTSEGPALWTELAQRLHESGQPRESREVLEKLSESTESRRHFYQLFEEWNRQRLEAEGEALKDRCARLTGPDELTLELAANLIQRGRAEEVIPLLATEFTDQNERARRACLLASAHLELDQAQRAESILLAHAGTYDDSDLGDEIEFLLADCAGRLGRWGESHARYLELLESPRFGPRARTRAKAAYHRYLEDTAGSYRAVLNKVSDLNDEPENPQEKS